MCIRFCLLRTCFLVALSFFPLAGVIFGVTLEGTATAYSRPLEQKILPQILALKKLGVDAVVFGKSLASFEGEKQLRDYLKANVPIKNTNDIYTILYNRVAFQRGERGVDRGLLHVYDIFFNDLWKPEEMRITIFSGGSGSNRLTTGLLQYTDKIDMLINAYDDLKGTSNGSIRREFDVLGPSDIGKNLMVLLDMSYSENRAFQEFLKYRLSKEENIEALRKDFEVIARGGDGVRDGTLHELLGALVPEYRKLVGLYFEGFLTRVRKWEGVHRATFDFRDYAVRNILYTGLLFNENGDYAKSIEIFRKQFHVKPNIVLNSYQGLWLVGLTANGNILNSEGDVCQSLKNEEIENVFLVKTLLDEKELNHFYELTMLEEKRAFLESLSVPIQVSDEAREALSSAQMILYAPTTFYSNVVPTLQTVGVPDLLRQSKALKIQIANLSQERGKKTLGEHLADLLPFSASPDNVGIDYVIANDNGYCNGAGVGPLLLPVDGVRIKNLNLELIELNVADPKMLDHHKGDFIARIVVQLKALDVAGYQISQGGVVKKARISSSCVPSFADMTPDEAATYRQNVEKRFDRYAKKTYQAVFLDVDGTITDRDNKVPEKVVQRLREYVCRGIYVGINTARTDGSLRGLLLDSLLAVLGNKEELLKKVYVYTNNGAQGYTLDGTVLYEQSLAPHVAESAMEHICHEVLKMEDRYRVSAYKITIWPREEEDTASMIRDINRLLRKNLFPLVARAGSGSGYGAKTCIIITGDQASKRYALMDFVKRAHVSIDSILKVGDRGEAGGVDNDWLIGEGSFSVGAFDVNGTQVPTVLLSDKLEGLPGSMWLFDNMKMASCL